MPSVYRKRYSASIPTNAKRATATIKGKPCPVVHAKDSDGRAVVYPLNKAGTKMRIPSPCWYGKVGGKDVKLFTNREASKTRLRELLEKHERGQTSLKVTDSAGSSLTDHLKDWRAHLEAKESKAKHVNQFVGSVRRVIEACGFRTPSDIQVDPVRRYLLELKKDRAVPALPEGQESFTRAQLAELTGLSVAAISCRLSYQRLPAAGNGRARRYPRATAERLLSTLGQGAAPKTIREYVLALRSFCRWLVEEERVYRNPLLKLRAGKGRSGDRHKRRPLTPTELKRLLQTTRASVAVRRGMGSEDRFWLYALAACTGFRVGELASLTPQSFLLGSQPTVYLPPEDSKNGKGADQPLPGTILDDLRIYLSGKDHDAPIWPGNWLDRSVGMFRPDLAAAGIPYIIDGPGGVPLHADMHSLRHTFIRLLDLAGTSLKEAMQLARHSDPKLTMAVYGQAGAEDLAAKVNAIGADCFPVASLPLPQTGDPE